MQKLASLQLACKFLSCMGRSSQLPSIFTAPLQTLNPGLLSQEARMAGVPGPHKTSHTGPWSPSSLANSFSLSCPYLLHWGVLTNLPLLDGGSAACCKDILLSPPDPRALGCSILQKRFSPRLGQSVDKPRG